ncbi:hypothetical protein NSS94_11800 [Paenibacillus sp. FSL L8-0644]|uniref:hypothetical protein n=1 Tax=Paenibacillus sp. FSL L8-0644 TaxID=2954523 RepID=UPI0030F736C6
MNNKLHFTEGQRVTVPTGVSLFPKELPTPPRSWVERVYNITYWEKANKGGHFAAMENPKLFADHLNHFFSFIKRLIASILRGAMQGG